MIAINRARFAYMLYSAILVALGIVLIIFRGYEVNTIAKMTGILILVCGIVKILLYFVNDTYGLAFQFDFALGIFSVVIGLVLITQPVIILEVLNVIIGIFVIADGSFKLQTAKDAKEFGMSYWWIILALAIITTINGILLALSQLACHLEPGLLIGIAFILLGIENFYVAFYTVKLVKRFKHIGKRS